MGLLKAVLEESEAFRKAYAPVVAEKKKVRSILVEAASEDSKRIVFDVNSIEFKEALKQIPVELVDLIYDQMKIEPVHLVEIPEDDSQDEFAISSDNSMVPNYQDEEENIENDDD
ncbi:MAG: hypothetical protein E7035_02750 [Verrucomicrobiaceae bacterium]|nr:hypothetical protein [Verrucomicrobiaceae bacterium]